MFHSIRQNETMDCGPTCLKMIMKFYGKTIGIQVLRDLCAIDSHGVSINGILEASKKMHFKSLAIKTVIHTTSDKSDTQITEIPLPAILHWSNNHFVVLYKIKNGQYFIADPAIGKIRLSADRFNICFIQMSPMVLLFYSNLLLNFIPIRLIHLISWAKYQYRHLKIFSVITDPVF
jgi:ATP-binding cassette subfamily B protein